MSGSTKQVVQFPIRSPVLSTDNILLQEGGAGAAYGYAPVAGLSSIFYPVTGGSLSGPLTVHGLLSTTGTGTFQLPGFVSMGAAPGVVGNGSTDDTLAIQNFLNGLAPGTTVLLPANTFYAINSANLTIPGGVGLVGTAPYAGPPFYAGSTVSGAGFYLNPLRTIVLSTGASLRGLRVYRQGLLAAPTSAQVVSAVAQWGSEAVYLTTTSGTALGSSILTFGGGTAGVSVGQPVFGPYIQAGSTVVGVSATAIQMSLGAWGAGVASGKAIRFGSSVGITLLSNGPGGPSGGNVIQDVSIAGFQTGIQAGCGNWNLQRIWIDCYNGVESANAGDWAYLEDVRCEPYYGISVGTPTLTSLSRPGTGMWFRDGGTGYFVKTTFCFCWQFPYVFDNCTNNELYGMSCEDAAHQAGGIGIQYLNGYTGKSFGGQISGFGTAGISVQNPSAGQFPRPRIIAPQFICQGAGIIIGASTDGTLVYPEFENTSSAAVSGQANIAGQWVVIGPSFITGMPATWAVVDSTSTANINCIIQDINQSFFRNLPTGDAGGGGLRGGGSVDLQVARTAASQVCAGAQAAILGGADNTLASTATWSVIVGGKNNSVSGSVSTAGGINNQLTGNYTTVFGGNATDRGRTGVFVMGPGPGAGTGFQQLSFTSMGWSTTSAASAAQLTVDRGAPGAANVLNIVFPQVYGLDINVIATDGDGSHALWGTSGLVMLIGGAAASATVLVGSGALALRQSTSVASGWAVQAAADTTNGGLAIFVTGSATSTLNWTAMVRGTEVVG